MQIRHRFAALTLGAALLASPVPRVFAQGSSSAISDILSRYEQGAPLSPAVVSTLAAQAADGSLLKALELSGASWISAAGAANVDRRRLVVAGVALEALLAERRAAGMVEVPVIQWVDDQLR